MSLASHFAMSTVFAPWEGYNEKPSGVVLESASTIYNKPAPTGGTPIAVRRKSILSVVVHRRIRGVGFIFYRGSVDRLTSIKGLDVVMALKCISEEMRRLEPTREGSVEDASLEECLAGFQVFADKMYRCIIPIPLTENWGKWLYHDSAICTITNKCWYSECPHVVDSLKGKDKGEREKEGGEAKL